ncbi:MAG TPA: hypothetical protein VH478_11735 [Trebonia sp.]|nr:hypothetical protein [Trebonia sp.]
MSRGHRQRLSAYWRSPAGLVIAGATLLALGLRVAILTQSSFLTSGSVEYDDGVYLGAAIRLLQGSLPYKDYAFIQPPGILLVSLPAAVIAKLSSAAAGLAAARVATACASAACVALAGNLVRSRGALVTTVTCGLLAVYPADVLASRTLLLEPWMNVCCLLAATIALRAGCLAGPRRLAAAGLLLGFAGTVKFWAVVPAAILLFVILAAGGPRWTRAAWYAPAVAAGFIVPVLALGGTSVAGFLRDTLQYQASRVGQSTPMALRLDHLTGITPLLDRAGFSLSPGSYTLFQAAGTASMEPTRIPLAVPLAVALIMAAALVIPYVAWRRDRTHLEWLALGTAIGACAAILSYSAFFYHYPAFPAPWLAIAAGAAAGAVARAGAGTWLARGRRLALAVGGIALAAAVAVELAQVNAEFVRGNPPIAAIIPAGACVVSDQVAVTVAADRFTAARPGCPDVIDALAQTLVLSHGVSPAGGAGNHLAVITAWESILGRARYVWLTGGYKNRIPWTPALSAWFTAHFHLVAALHGYADSHVYERDAT